MQETETSGFGPFGAAEIADLMRHLRGVRQALLRVIGQNEPAEAALTEILLALGVSVRCERIGLMAPDPTRRIGVRYEGDIAIITLVADIC